MPADDSCNALNASASRVFETFKQLDERAEGILVIAFRDMGSNKLGISYHTAGAVPNQLHVASLIVASQEKEDDRSAK